MSLDDYAKARKIGLRQERQDVSAGRFPYPPALDDILSCHGSRGELSLGTFEVGLDLVVGTKTRARQESFSRGFMPLLEASTEFGAKWAALADVQRDEGIRDPIVAYEYLQRLYVQEGNKRVSVLRYAGARSVSASVTRVLPMPQDSEEYRIYQEFLRFWSVCPFYGLDFSYAGAYAHLASLMDLDLEHPWPDDAVADVRAGYVTFSDALARHGGALDLRAGDAFLIYLGIYGATGLGLVGPKELDERVGRIWPELVVSESDDRVVYLERPTQKPAASVPGLVAMATSAMATHPFRAAFLYDRDPATDGWDAMHERGRIDLERRLADEDQGWSRLVREGVRVISCRDYPIPGNPDEPWGLCVAEREHLRRVAEPVWGWGRYYELIVRAIKNDAWRKDGTKLRDHALNYWWGIAEGVVDVSLSDEVPYQQRQLVESLRRSLLAGVVHPFAGELVSQAGLVQAADAGRLSSEAIVRMGWLNHNVEGRIPVTRSETTDAGGAGDESGLVVITPEDPPVGSPLWEDPS